MFVLDDDRADIGKYVVIWESEKAIQQSLHPDWATSYRFFTFDGLKKHISEMIFKHPNELGHLSNLRTWVWLAVAEEDDIFDDDD